MDTGQFLPFRGFLSYFFLPKIMNDRHVDGPAANHVILS